MILSASGAHGAVFATLKPGPIKQRKSPTPHFEGDRKNAKRKINWRSLDGMRLLLALLAAMVGGGAVSNIPPQNTVATARPSLLGAPLPWVDAYLVENGDVINPVFRFPQGHITEDGKATGMFGLPKGQGTEDGKIYRNIIPVEGASLPTPSGTMDEDGNVKGWVLPKGTITAEENVPKAQKTALGLWLWKVTGKGSSSKK